MPQYRHEWKHRLNGADLVILRQRLRQVMMPDIHASDGTYFIRSLYFDDGSDTALREKLDGVSKREKFRIRYYNFDPSLIHLEKKSKICGLGIKETVTLTPQQTQAIINRDTDWMKTSSQPLLQELHRKTTGGLRPKTIVDYTREAFVFPPGNVRVTLDYHIRTGLSCTDFLNTDCITIPVPEDPILLEVKWDNFLPTVIRDAVQLNNRHAAAFSKYAICRVYD
ncbi:MAG: polyphosphate polymerase domain-containing protein [Oscillospiraceae bacterium]|nr:polyphosphate polymerase domain-containing protein [Oscillospiraceae bacterium]